MRALPLWVCWAVTSIEVNALGAGAVADGEGKDEPTAFSATIRYGKFVTPSAAVSLYDVTLAATVALVIHCPDSSR